MNCLRTMSIEIRSEKLWSKSLENDSLKMAKATSNKQWTLNHLILSKLVHLLKERRFRMPGFKDTMKIRIQ